MQMLSKFRERNLRVSKARRAFKCLYVYNVSCLVVGGLVELYWKGRLRFRKRSVQSCPRRANVLQSLIIIID